VGVAKAEKLTECRICKNSNLENYLDLGLHPASNSFILAEQISDERKFPLVIMVCTNCGLSQLNTIVSVEEIFDDYAYRSSTSRALMRSFADLASRVDILNSETSRRPLVVDIGCNDGYLLKQFDSHHYATLGVEPSSAALDAVANGFTVEKIFFGADSSVVLKEKYGDADFILVTNVLAHVPDIRSFVEGISNWLSTSGIFVVEFPYVLDMVRNRWFDTVYHEHLSYLAISPLTRLFSEFGLTIFDIEKCEIGGSGPFLRVFVKKSGSQLHPVKSVVGRYTTDEEIFGITEPVSYSQFSREVLRIREVLVQHISKWNALGYLVGGYGAPAKGNTMLNFLNLEDGQIKFIADNTPEKIGRVAPGTHIPVVGDLDFLDTGVKHALLLSWNYVEYFREHSSFIKSGGEFLVPFPVPFVVSSESSNS
jgi:SAM-dependent methyltransferase